MGSSFKENPLKTPNIAAASIALGIVALILLAAAVAGEFVERKYVHVLAPVLFPEKSQGIVLQRIAFGDRICCRYMVVRSW